MSMNGNLDEIALGDMYPVDALPVIRRAIAGGREGSAYESLRECVGRIIPEKGHDLRAWISVMTRASLLAKDPVISVKIEALGELLAVGLDQESEARKMHGSVSV